MRLTLCGLLLGWWGVAQVPGILSHQGKLTVNGTNFAGVASFKFALVTTNGAGGDRTLWSHDHTSVDGGEPSGVPVALPVARGVFSVNLGDVAVANMAGPIPAGVFGHEYVGLRVWVNDGVNGSLRLAPDRRVTSVGYALAAHQVLSPAASATNFSGVLAGDVTGPQGATVVGRVGGLLAASVATGAAVANGATAASSPDTLVKRDSQGNFSAGTVTGSRFVGDASGLTNFPAAQLQGAVPRGALLASGLASDPALLAAGYRLTMSVPAPAWMAGATLNAPSARAGHTALWLGTSMLVWGGQVGVGTYTATGGLYDGAADVWTATSSLGAPTARAAHSAVWTGSEMLVWGGRAADYLGTGGRFAPATQTWSGMATAGAPSAREGHIAVWTGSRMIVWGGRNLDGLRNDGGLYDPAADVWTALPGTGAPEGRMGAAAVWAGDRLLVWGGTGAGGDLDSGGQLLFTNGVASGWTGIPWTGAPQARSLHRAVWAVDRLLVWGGQNAGVPLGDGAAFCPSCDAWEAVSSTNAPVARAEHLAVWTGVEMLVFGGRNAVGDLASGAAYDPVALEWRPLSSLGNPLARAQATAVWSGAELFVFGGRAGTQPVGTLQRLSPQPAWYFYRKL